MSEFRRRLMIAGSGEGEGGDLPAGYTRLQYIYNTSNAYIDTGIAVGNTDEVDCFWLNAGAPGGDKALFGARDTTSMYSWVNRYGSGGQVYFRWGAKVSGNYVTINGRILIKNNICYLYKDDGVTPLYSWDSNAGTFQMTTTLALFAQHDAVTNSLRYPCKGVGLEYFKIVGKFDAIPCINNNNVVGMYDIVSQTFFSSPNGTAFVAGPLYE